MPQKDRSGILRFLWDEENNRNKWALIGKAYSFIRDCVGSENALYLDFMEIVQPALGIIHKDEVFDVRGWEFEHTDDGLEMFCTGNRDQAVIDAHDMVTSISVRDIVELCYRNGYGIPALDTEFDQPAASVNTFAIPPGLLYAGQVLSQNQLGVQNHHATQNPANVPTVAYQSVLAENDAGKRHSLEQIFDPSSFTRPFDEDLYDTLFLPTSTDLPVLFDL